MSFIIQQLSNPYLISIKNHENVQPLKRSTIQQIKTQKSYKIPLNQNIKLKQKLNLDEFEKYFINQKIKIILHKNMRYIYQKSQLIYSIRIIINQFQYLKIPNRDRRLLLLKIIHKFTNLKLTFSLESGLTKIILLHTKLININHISQLISLSVQRYIKFQELKKILQFILNGHLIHPYHISNEGLTNNHLENNIRNTLGRINIGLSLTSTMKAETSTQKIYQKQISNQSKIFQSQVPLSNQQIRQLCLYSQVQPNAYSKKVHYFTQAQLLVISNKIKAPNMIKPRNSLQNNCILNFIKINNSQKLKFIKINSGGFSNIYKTEIQYWYVFSGRENQIISPISDSTFTSQNMIRKSVIVKRDDGHQKRSRVQHQKRILKKMKNGHAIFIPKYYVPFSQANQMKNLYADYFPNTNLAEYLKIHQDFLSLPTKILLLLMISQGVRFINQYNIYHLDLKPQNVIVISPKIIKIIDFGESYHSEVCDSNFIPGFSMPYSSPECFYPVDLEVFTQKCDIFSIGVMAYQILNNRLPYYFYDQEQRFQRYTQQNIEQYWFYNPEYHSQNYGYIYSLLQLVIGRCLKNNPSERPTIDWLCLIIRQYCDFYY